MQQCGLPCPGEHLRLSPLLRNRYTKTKKKKCGTNEKQIRAPEKIQLSDEEIANLSDAQFKTLVIRMLTELIEHGCKSDEKMRAMLSEIKENVGTGNQQ